MYKPLYILTKYIIIYIQKISFTATVGGIQHPAHSSGTKCDCKIDWLWVRSPLEEMKYLLKFIFPFLRSGVEANAMPPEFGRKSGTVVLTLGSLCLP